MPPLPVGNDPGGPFDLTLDALATWRLTRLAVEDTITEPGRRAVLAFIAGAAGPRAEEYARDLLGCYWCTGWWVSLGVLVARRRRWWPVVRWALALSAITGAAGDRF